LAVDARLGNQQVKVEDPFVPSRAVAHSPLPNLRWLSALHQPRNQRAR
jgi:hypothetical protein